MTPHTKQKLKHAIAEVIKRRLPNALEGHNVYLAASLFDEIERIVNEAVLDNTARVSHIAR